MRPPRSFFSSVVSRESVMRGLEQIQPDTLIVYEQCNPFRGLQAI